MIYSVSQNVEMLNFLNGFNTYWIIFEIFIGALAEKFVIKWKVLVTQFQELASTEYVV